MQKRKKQNLASNILDHAASLFRSGVSLKDIIVRISKDFEIKDTIDADELLKAIGKRPLPDFEESLHETYEAKKALCVRMRLQMMKETDIHRAALLVKPLAALEASLSETSAQLIKLGKMDEDEGGEGGDDTMGVMRKIIAEERKAALKKTEHERKEKQEEKEGEPLP